MCFLLALQPYYQPVHPGQEMSLEYSMFMPPNLPPREFNMKIQLYFSVEDTMLANMFFNQVRWPRRCGASVGCACGLSRCEGKGKRKRAWVTVQQARGPAACQAYQEDLRQGSSQTRKTSGTEVAAMKQL